MATVNGVQAEVRFASEVFDSAGIEQHRIHERSLTERASFAVLGVWECMQDGFRVEIAALWWWKQVEPSAEGTVMKFVRMATIV